MKISLKKKKKKKNIWMNEKEQRGKEKNSFGQIKKLALSANKYQSLGKLRTFFFIHRALLSNNTVCYFFVCFRET